LEDFVDVVASIISDMVLDQRDVSLNSDTSSESLLLITTIVGSVAIRERAHQNKDRTLLKDDMRDVADISLPIHLTVIGKVCFTLSEG
jgi:hypothetical protein